jgi:predicted nucleic acid-binding protein
MDKDKIKKMSKDEVMKELERLTSKPTNKNMISLKTPDYKIFKKPKPKAEDYFSKEFLEELNDYIHDKDAKKTLKKMIKNKNDDSSSSSDED